MYLTSLTINGFKSFAKKGELSFSTPITAIVGPNGSGKSNVAESFRFVLGEQSIKSMRGKKGEDLIFNGSEGVSRLNRASVTIALNNPLVNGKRVFPLDFEEITIERAVHRDGENEYLINGAKTRLKDVQELLAAANIGPTGHHIISQGEADRILSANARERREMIEDALGLKVYQFKKAESERKLKKTRENILQVESLRREVAPHLKFLEKQVKKIERSIELQEELKNVYAEYLVREDAYIAHHHDALTAARHEPTVRLEEVRKALHHAKEVLARETKDEKRDELLALESNMSEVRKRRHDITRTIGQIEGQILFLTRRIETAKEKALHVTGSPIPYALLEENTRSFESQIDRVLQSNDVKEMGRVLRDILHSLKRILTNAQSGDFAHDTKDEENELRTLQAEKSTQEQSLATVGAEEEALRGTYESLKAAIDADRSHTRDMEHELFARMQEERELVLQIERIDRELGLLERDRDEFKRELQEAVSLLGRSAALYFEYTVQDAEGNPVSKEVMVSEERTIQIERRRTLEKMKIRLEELGMGVHEDVLKEYKDVKERDEFLVREIADLNESVLKLEELIADLTLKLNEQFESGIEKIGVEFHRFFTLMFGGGSAKLVRVKPKVKKIETEADTEIERVESEVEEAPTEEGIDIDVKLPNKRVNGLDMLSGGERALTSIALIFAMSQVNPPLFVILDETDAALDEANSRRYGDMISALAERSQLILITHNRETMSRAGVLYGVTMAGDGVSRLLSVQLDQAVAVAK